jgi:hypothetical protein
VDQPDALVTVANEVLGHVSAAREVVGGDLVARDVIDDWPLAYLGVAETELEGLVHAWARNEANQVGETTVMHHEVNEFETIGNLDTATSTACVDRGGLEYVDVNGDEVDIHQPPVTTHRWHMTWHYIELDGQSAWLLDEAEVQSDEDC